MLSRERKKRGFPYYSENFYKGDMHVVVFENATDAAIKLYLPAVKCSPPGETVPAARGALIPGPRSLERPSPVALQSHTPLSV